MPGIQFKTVPLSYVSSGPTPQAGQNNRSSGNFTTDEIPAGATGLYWEIYGINAKDISFNVMMDHSGGADPVIFTDVKNGFTTKPVVNRKLYIANPKNSKAIFTVRVYALLP
ncbi:MAG: DeoR family transcriptional regulator [Bacteroidota bacterium]